MLRYYFKRLSKRRISILLLFLFPLSSFSNVLNNKEQRQLSIHLAKIWNVGVDDIHDQGIKILTEASRVLIKSLPSVENKVSQTWYEMALQIEKVQQKKA